MNFNQGDLIDQNELLQEQLEITRMNSDEIRDQISLTQKLANQARITREQALSINRTNREISNLNKSIIDQLKERNGLERSLKEISKDQLKNKKIQQSLENEINQLAIQAQGLRGRAKSDINKLIFGLQQQLDASEEINKSLTEEARLVDVLNKKLGLAPEIMNGFSKALEKLGFGNVSKQLGIEDAIRDTKEWIVANNGNVTSFQTMGRFTGNIMKNLSGMISPANMLQAGLTLLIKSMISFDKMTGEVAKNMGISYSEASKLNQELTQIASTSKNTFITTKSLVEAYNSINSALGTNAELSGELLSTHTELTKQAGYSVETANTLSKLSLVTNKSSKDLTTTYLGQVKALNLKHGLAINEKALLNDISNVSKATLVTFSKNPAELAKAAFEAKKVGLELKQIEGISSSLLDIESSIAAEFEAEVMTGKALNLERARYYALTNDISGLSQELNKQGIDSLSFSKLNVIQQESQAKALGMSRDEMGKMLIEQEAISKLSGIDGKNAKEKFDNLVKEVGLEEAKKRLGNDTLANQMASTSTQERFLALTEKLQEVFIAMAGPIMDVVSPLMDLISTITAPIAWISENFGSWGEKLGEMIGPLGTVGKILKGIAMLAVGYAAYSAFASLSAIPIVGPVLGGVAAAGIIAAGTSFIGSIQDGAIDPSGGLVVSGPKGSIQLDSEDTFVGNKNGIIAGTDLGKKEEKGNNKSISNDGNITLLSSMLGGKMDTMIGKLDLLIGAVNKGMVVNLDGNKVSHELQTPLAISNRTI